MRRRISYATWRVQGAIRDFFVGEDPTFWVAMAPLLVLSAILYTRELSTNYIFDEQEALLANPYVHGKNLRWLDAFRRDFWGLPPDRSVGSYRPIPDVIWRLLWHVSQSPWLHHWINVLLHAANGACLVLFVFLTSRRRGFAWLSGVIFTACAVLTEAVSGVVGIADVLGGLGAMLALLALCTPLWVMPWGVAAAVFFGLFSKESALVAVPLLPFAALVLAPLTHPARPRRVLRAALALVAALGAFVAYVEIRKRAFPAPIESTLNVALPAGASRAAKLSRAFFLWFHQPPLPKDAINNPLINADLRHRIAGALRVYWRGLTQLLVPLRLAGDYSSPQEPIPARLLFPESVLGALAFVLPPLLSLGLWLRNVFRPRGVSSDGPTLLVAFALTWIVVSYFPHSNIPVLLPTVRAERFWYFPAIGSSILLAAFFAYLYRKTSRLHDSAPAVGLFVLFFTFQCGKAYEHSTHYRDDLSFWSATREAVPRSAKAHLNYSVMWGARGRLDIRLEANRIAAALAPEWPMAHVYLGDTLCRLHRPEEAWAHYEHGFVLAENDPNLLSLGLQCLWEERVPDATAEGGTVRAFSKHEDELIALANERTGTWLAYLVNDLSANGEKNQGVDPKYRPRGYNEGPKD